MESVMESMYSNQVQVLVDPREVIIPIRCKWIFKRKIDSDGQVSTYNVRLVVKGYYQHQGIDYDITFSPVMMLKSIMMMLAIVTYYDCEI